VGGGITARSHASPACFASTVTARSPRSIVPRELHQRSPAATAAVFASTAHLLPSSPRVVPMATRPEALSSRRSGSVIGMLQMRAEKPQIWLTRKEATSTSQKRESKSSFTAGRRERMSTQMLKHRRCCSHFEKRGCAAGSRTKDRRCPADAEQPSGRRAGRRRLLLRRCPRTAEFGPYHPTLYRESRLLPQHGSFDFNRRKARRP